MTISRDAWIADYLAALRQYVAEKAEAALEVAYDLGRQASIEGWSVLEIVEAHHSEVANLVQELGPGAQSAAVVEAAEDFLMQGLAPFEMTRRGFQEAIEALRREVVARRQGEVELRRQAQDLARSNEELERFAYAASHDLQEPLRMVTSYSQLLAQRYRGKMDADADEFIGFAVDGAKRMSAMIDGLLQYSRVRRAMAGDEPTDCEAVLQHALGNLRVAVEESGAEITHDPLPTVKGNAILLQQLFQNLVGNAIKFRAEHPPRVHVSAERQDDEWWFSVRDNGIGIDPQYAERIFIVFQRLHTREEYPGAGIGLAIARRIVEQHGGRMWVESEPGNAATFYFTLPSVAEQAAAA